MAGNKKFHLSTLTIDFMRVLLVWNALKTLVKQRGLIFRTGRGNDSRQLRENSCAVKAGSDSIVVRKAAAVSAVYSLDADFTSVSQQAYERLAPHALFKLSCIWTCLDMIFIVRPLMASSFQVAFKDLNGLSNRNSFRCRYSFGHTLTTVVLYCQSTLIRLLPNQ